MLSALLSFICGVILDVIVKKHKQLYEIILNFVPEVRFLREIFKSSGHR